MASIHQEKRGYWVASLNLPGVKGKRKRKAFYGKTRLEAEQKLEKALRDLEAGIPIEMRKIRARGEGSVYQMDNGRWHAALMVDGTQHHFYGATKIEAQKKLSDFLGPRKPSAFPSEQIEALAQKEHLAMLKLQQDQWVLDADTLLKRLFNGSIPATKETLLAVQGFYKSHPTTAD